MQKADMFDIKTVKLPTENEIVAAWKRDDVILSVFCLAYQHQEYIADTLTGILMQETDFAYEIIIHDDCSDDDTLKVVSSFEEKYPNIIKTIVQTENRFSKGTNPINHVLAYSSGKYICICEGDDYWIDKDKLQNHMLFFRDNPEYVLHVYDCVEQRGDVIDYDSSKLARISVKEGDYDQDQLSRRFCLLPLTSCFVNDFELPLPRYFNKSINGDTLLNIMLSRKGKAFVDGSKKVGVYRLHEGGVWSQIESDSKLYETLHTNLVKSRYFSDKENVGQWFLVDTLIKIIKRLGPVKIFTLIIKKLWLKFQGN